MAELESYFRGRIRAANSVMNEARIEVELRKGEVMNAAASLQLGDGTPSSKGGKNRRIIVQEERVCRICHKRLGRSVIAVLPDNSVVHYGCVGRDKGQSERPRTGSWGRKG